MPTKPVTTCIQSTRISDGTINNQQNTSGTYTTNTYGYNDSAHVHAVTHLNGTQKYWYDANGNQIKRIVGGYTYDLKYDAENRLVEVKKNSVAIATFVYNGDGERVQSQMGSTTTGFVGNYFEWIVGTTSSVKKYYYAGSQRVTMRTGSSTLNFLLGDHLGSTSVTTSASGTSPKYQLYKPFGEVRYTSSALPTKYTFTGQYSNVADFGLMYYGARWNDVSLGRFAQADTIIPGAGNPMAWDRYSYTLNNPVKYTDPSGHWYKPGERGMQVGFGMGHIPLVGYGPVSNADQSKLDAAYVMLGRTDSGRSTAEFILSENVTFVLAVDYNELPTTYVVGENGSVQYSWAPLTIDSYDEPSITVEHPIKLGLGYPEYDTGQLAGVIVHEAYHANRAQKYGTCDSLEEEHSAYKVESAFLAEARSKGYTNYDSGVWVIDGYPTGKGLLDWSKQYAFSFTQYNGEKAHMYDGYPIYPSNSAFECGVRQ